MLKTLISSVVRHPVRNLGIGFATALACATSLSQVTHAQDVVTPLHTPSRDVAVPFTVICREQNETQKPGEALKPCAVSLSSFVDSSGQFNPKPDAFRGKHFQIHLGESRDPISFSSAPEVVRRAASVYFHLERARQFAARSPELSTYESKIAYPIVIRLEMTAPYSDAVHFARNKPETYNNSLTIRRSLRAPPAGVEPWGEEIWFYQSKNVESPSDIKRIAGFLSLRAYRNMLLQQMIYTDLQDVGREQVSGYGINWIGHLASLASSLTITELLLPLFRFGTQNLTDTRALDTAYIPEVVYHEFAHLLFQSKLGLRNPTALVEGYPNLFASQVSRMPNLQARAGRYLKKFTPKRGSDTSIYASEYEVGLSAATGSFVYSLLFQLRQIFNSDGSRAMAEGDKIIYGALDELDGDSHIQSDFERSIMNSIDRNSSNPVLQRIRALTVFQKRGL